MNKLIIISGPTATGKTKTSIELAKHIESIHHKKCAIVNFDSLLFYKEITIGTAKPTPSERKNIEHFLVDIESITNPLNAADYIEMAKNIIFDLHQKNIIPILVGGSAFYLRALLKGMYDSKSSDNELKEEIKKIYSEQGIAPFISFLKINDPEILKIYHENDHYRITRAYEHVKTNGTKISEQKKLLDELDPYDFSKIEQPWDVCHFYLDLPKEEHIHYIETRTKLMINEGLIEEVKNLLNNGYNPELKPLKSIGYSETIDYLNNQFKSKDDYIERIIISTRQLAKSQRTFFKKIKPKYEINPLSEQARILEIIKSFL